MFAYYLRLGWASLGRNPILTTLMVLGIALGVGTSMTTLTVMYLMGSDPIPWKSRALHVVQVDNWDHVVQVDNWDPAQGYNADGSPPDQLTYRDAMAFLQAHKADRQAVMYKVSMPVQPDNADIKPFNSLGRATYADFFAMFEPPFKYGGSWDRGQDDQHARVVVLSDKTNEKLFGGSDSVGRRVRLNDIDYDVVGVLAPWQPRIKFYDLSNGAPQRAGRLLSAVHHGDRTEDRQRRQQQLLEQHQFRLGGLSRIRMRVGCRCGCKPTARPRTRAIAHIWTTTSPSRRSSAASRDR